MKLGWATFAAFLLLVVAKVGLMHWHTESARTGADARPFDVVQEQAGTVAARARPLWKPILL